MDIHTSIQLGRQAYTQTGSMQPYNQSFQQPTNRHTDRHATRQTYKYGETNTQTIKKKERRGAEIAKGKDRTQTHRKELSSVKISP